MHNNRAKVQEVLRSVDVSYLVCFLLQKNLSKETEAAGLVQNQVA